MISDSRRHVVEKARQVWIRKLIDLSRRNNLLYYRPLKTGTLDLSSAPVERLRELLGGESVPASKLLPDLEDEVIKKSLQRHLPSRAGKLGRKGPVHAVRYLWDGELARDGRRPSVRSSGPALTSSIK